MFALGELADACSDAVVYAWPYPKDGKQYWWRDDNKKISQVVHILLPLSLLVFVMVRLNFWLALIIAIIIILRRAWVYYHFKNYGEDDERIQSARRTEKCLWIIGLYVLCLYLLWQPVTLSSIILDPRFNFWSKVLLTIASVLFGFLLVALRHERLKEDKTPLEPEYLGKHGKPMRKWPPPKRTPRSKKTRMKHARRQYADINQHQSNNRKK